MGNESFTFTVTKHFGYPVLVIDAPNYESWRTLLEISQQINREADSEDGLTATPMNSERRLYVQLWVPGESDRAVSEFIDRMQADEEYEKATETRLDQSEVEVLRGKLAKCRKTLRLVRKESKKYVLGGIQ